MAAKCRLDSQMKIKILKSIYEGCKNTLVLNETQGFVQSPVDGLV